MADSQLHIRDTGDGRPLVLLHGWSCPGQFFDDLVKILSPHARCIVPDLPGHGKTGDRLPLTIESGADAVHAFLETEGLSDAIVCGWSMGAFAAYSLIERHGPERIAGVVAIDMTPKVLNDDDWKNGTSNGLTADINELVLAGILAHWDRMPDTIAGQLFAADEPVDDALLSYATSEIAKGDPALLQPMWASLCAQDFRDFLKSFPVPLHFASGVQSQLYGPGVTRWYEENVSGVQIKRFGASGHSPHLEETGRFSELMQNLL